MIVVSHRGPFRFHGERRRQRSPPDRGAGGVVERARLPLLERAHATPRWIARRDRRRRPRRRGRRRRRRRAARRSSCSTSTPTLQRLHYDVVSNAMLWFLHHGLFDLPAPAALRPPLPRGVGRVRRGQPVVRRRGRRRSPARARSCSCRTTSSRWCPRMLRERRPDLRVVHFTHTPFCGPELDPRCCPTTSPRRCARRMAGGAGGLPHRALGRAFRASAREVARRRRRRRPDRSPRRSAPTPSVLAAEVADPPRPRTRSPRSTSGRRPPADRAQRPDRAVEEHRARLPRVRPAARRAARVRERVSCSSRC